MAIRCTIAVVMCACLATVVEAKPQGALGLDSLTFDKVVDGSRDILVKIDKEYAYGDAEDAFKQVCKTVGVLKTKFLIGEVGVQDYGDKENDDLRERYGVSKDDLPVFKLFKKGDDVDKPIDYTGDKTEEGLVKFLKLEIGLYIGLPGNVEAFDKLAGGFLALDKGKQEERLTDAEAAETSTTNDEAEFAKFYVKTMKKILDKGAGFIDSETIRLKKLIAGKISDKKKKMFEERLNILPSFTKDEL